MLGSLSRLKGLLDRPAHTFRPTMETFPDLDIQRIAEELKLVERGRERGTSEQPASAETALDAVEAEVVEHVAAAQKISLDELENQLTGFRQRLIDLDFEARFAGIKDVAQGGLADLKAEQKLGLNDLHEVRRDNLEAETYLAEFKKRNKIWQPPKIGNGLVTTLKVILIILLFAGELVANGYYLSRGDELGLAGGILQSILFSGLNVGGPLLIALVFLPNLYHRNWIRKFWGLLWLAFYLVGIGVLNLGIAHYREVGAETIAEAGIRVMARLQERPLLLDDFNSWVLFGLGVLFSLIALLDGLSFRDRYPGFQQASDNLRKARARYVDAHKTNIENLLDVREQYQTTVTELRGDLSKRRTEHEAIIAHRARKITLFREHQNQLEKSANALLRAYRDSNQQARKTQPPQRFAEVFNLLRIDVQIAKENEWNTEELKQAISGAQADLEAVMGTLTRFFDQALESYSELDKLTPGT